MTLREAVSRIEVLEQTQAQILAELRLLRRGQPRADADSLESLLGYVFDAFQEKPWAVAWVIESSIENPLLLGSIVHCLGRTPSVKGLSRFLGNHLGQWGEFMLRRTTPHSRDGVRYCLTFSRNVPDSGLTP